MSLLGSVANAAGLIQMGAIMLLGALALLWAKRRQAVTQADIRSLRLTPEHAVHVVRVGNRELLVGTGRGQVPALLVELTPATLELPELEEHLAPEGPRGV